MGDELVKRKVLLGVTGSVAVYKAAELARIYVTRGYTVRVAMTPSAAEFVSPLTFESITGSSVIVDYWDGSDPGSISHIEAADWADMLVIAPATAETISKLSRGAADTPLHGIALATRAPILIAPAMNTNMLENPITQENIKTLKDHGMTFVDPVEGDLACGWNGSGRLADPWDIFYHSLRAMSQQDFAGRRILLTTGPTREAIDPVRFISNRSSGKMGVSIAREAFRRGAEVTLVHGPVTVSVPSTVKTVPVTSAVEMQERVLEYGFSDGDDAPDIIIMAAAVADFRPEKVSEQKIKKLKDVPSISLVDNPDILSGLGKQRGKEVRPVLVGFAVETGEVEDMLEELAEKLQRKKVDMIVGNMAQDAFDKETNRVWILDKHGKTQEVATTFKSRVANKILDSVAKL